MTEQEKTSGDEQAPKPGEAEVSTAEESGEPSPAVEAEAPTIEPKIYEEPAPEPPVIVPVPPVIVPVPPVIVPVPPVTVREPSNDDDEIESTIRRMSRRSFLMGAVGVAAAAGGWYWLNSRNLAGGVSWPLRRMLGVDDKIAELYFRPGRLAQTFSESQVQPLRFNGDVGLGAGFDPAHWALRVVGSAATGPVTVDIEAIKRLPRHEMISEMKCIEGWSNIVHYAGARLSDFVSAYPPVTRSGAAVDVVGNPADLPAYMKKKCNAMPWGK